MREKKTKNWWKKLGYWKKGGIIGFLIGLLPLVNGLLFLFGKSPIFLLSFLAEISVSFFIILYYAGLQYILTTINIESGYALPTLLGWFLAPLVYSALGMVIGITITKMKKFKFIKNIKKNKKLKFKNYLITCFLLTIIFTIGNLIYVRLIQCRDYYPSLFPVFNKCTIPLETLFINYFLLFGFLILLALLFYHFKDCPSLKT